jgi:hypothetical protein
LLIFVITIFVNFLYLKNYPFVAVGDEVRDGGLDTVKIITGETSNIFAYGRYNAHGLIIPILNIPFYKIFYNSVLSYRVPAALISTIDVFLLFFIVTSLFGSNTAFWAALLLVCNPIHLFYSRTETVVIFSSLITTVLVYFSYRSIKHKWDFVYLALLIGFSFNFHASVKTVGMLLLPLIFFKILSFKKIKEIIFSIITSVIVLIIGFGPRLLETNLKIFFHTARLNTGFLNVFIFLNKYIESLKVIAFSPTTSHYLDHKPIISIPLFLLLLIGLFFLYKINRILFFIIIYLLLTIPLINSAITDIINADHRLIPLLPIISITISLAITSLSKFFPKKIRLIFIIILFSYLLFLAIGFFYYQKANINDYNNQRESKDYLSMHLIYLIQNNSFSKDIIIYASPYNVKNYNYLHYKEQYQFFLPNKNISFIMNDSLDNYSAILVNNQNRLFKINCLDTKNSFFCPLKDNKTFSIVY